MLILALESSAKAASVAVCEGETILSQYFQSSRLTHSRTLLAMAEDILKNLSLTMRDIDLVAVAKGPGSFTGVRIGVSAAKGLAWGADKPVCGVSTLEAMAYHCGDSGVVICPVMDARRNQIYNAKFSLGPTGLSQLAPDRAISVSELICEAKNSDLPFYLIGDGAEMCLEYFKNAGVSALIAPAPIRLQSAWGVARAALKGEKLSPNDLVPNYLRLSQAERERLEKAKEQII